ARGDVHELGRHAERAAALAAHGLARLAADHHAATPDAQIDRRVEVVFALEEDVAPHDAEVGRAVLHPGGHVVGLEQEVADAALAIDADELTPLGVERRGIEPRRLEARAELIEHAALGHGHHELAGGALGLRHSLPRMRSMRAPSPASLRSMCS